MEFTSILDKKDSPFREKPRPAFFRDLNLDQVIERIRLDWGEEVSAFYSYFPADRDCSDYRREVLSDMKQNGLYPTLHNFSGVMKERREAAVRKGEAKSGLQKAVWHLREVGCYCKAFGQLSRRIGEMELKSRGMQAFRCYLQQYLTSEGFQKMQSDTAGLLKELEGLRLVLTYDEDRITVTEGETEGQYDAFLEKCFPGHGKSLVSPFLAQTGLVELEEALLKALRKRKPAFFSGAERFYAEYETYADAVLIRFAGEIGYYLSFYRFETRMRERGFAFSEPLIAEERFGLRGQTDKEVGMYARGLYDLALACSGKDVVANDMAIHPGERFLLLTGPNQGGKTTFARSMGQLVYFARMGLDVPAVSAAVYPFTDIVSHFAVEESVETGRGKLREELERLADIMAASMEDGAFLFVIMNELFTTAANFDACIMGKRVLEHFLNRGCRGIYVTHLSGLAGEYSRLVSLRAMLDGEGRRTFRIERNTEETRADTGSLVGKHGLTYRQLKERLA